MGKRLIISESEKKEILSLYEQNETNYVNENEFLKNYVGKTFSVYLDKNYQTYGQPYKIKKITYNGDYLNIEVSITDKLSDELIVECLYNPSRFSYKIDTKYDKYNKTLIDDINQKGTAAGIKWCQKPKADFGTK